jgi:hypothetical protein
MRKQAENIQLKSLLSYWMQKKANEGAAPEAKQSEGAKSAPKITKPNSSLTSKMDVPKHDTNITAPATDKGRVPNNEVEMPKMASDTALAVHQLELLAAHHGYAGNVNKIPHQLFAKVANDNKLPVGRVRAEFFKKQAGWPLMLGLGAGGLVGAAGLGHLYNRWMNTAPGAGMGSTTSWGGQDPRTMQQVNQMALKNQQRNLEMNEMMGNLARSGGGGMYSGGFGGMPMGGMFR